LEANIMTLSMDSVIRSAGKSKPSACEPHAWWHARAVLSWLGLASMKPEPTAVRTTNEHRNMHHDKQAMSRWVQEMSSCSRREKQHLTVIVFDLSDLPELELVFGARVAKEVVTDISRKFERLATRRGLAVRTAPTVFTVLLPNADRNRAIEAIHATLGQPCSLEVEVDGDEVVLLPEFALETLVGNIVSIEECYDDLCREIAQTRQSEQRRLNYLTRERERHSQPSALQDPAPRPATKGCPVHRRAEVGTESMVSRRCPQMAPEVFHPPMPATIPVPMGVR
jgi:GGDEF domain-containing protein